MTGLTLLFVDDFREFAAVIRIKRAKFDGIVPRSAEAIFPNSEVRPRRLGSIKIRADKIIHVVKTL